MRTGGGLGLDAAVRAFVALPCAPALRRSIAQALGEWRALDADVAWVKPESSHLTLKFLGTADPDRLERLHARLGVVAGAAERVVAAPGATGAFPGWSRPRVLWLRVESDGAIEQLAGFVEAAAREARFDAEERPFTPHLTLGRVRSARGARTAASAVRAWSSGAAAEPIPELVLFRSELGPGGARHTPLARYPIG